MDTLLSKGDTTPFYFLWYILCPLSHLCDAFIKLFNFIFYRTSLNHFYLYINICRYPFFGVAFFDIILQSKIEYNFHT